MVDRGLIAKWTIIMVLSFLIFVVIVFLVKSGGFIERYVLWYLGKLISGKLCVLTLLSFSRTFDYRKVLIFSVIFVLHIGQDSSRSAQFSQVARWPQGRKVIFTRPSRQTLQSNCCLIVATSSFIFCISYRRNLQFGDSCRCFSVRSSWKSKVISVPQWKHFTILSEPKW